VIKKGADCMTGKKTVAQQDYENFLKMKENNEIPYERIKEDNRIYQKEIKSQLKELELLQSKEGSAAIERFLEISLAPQPVYEIFRKTQNKTANIFMDWIYKQSIENYYILDINPEKGVMLFNNNFTLMICLQLVTSNDIIEKFVYGEGLEIHNLTSIEKGEGYKAMKDVIAFARANNLTIVLWSETAKSAAYFERYGFKNCGVCGDNGEYFLTLPPLVPPLAMQ
jgi:hypothetical protein